MTTPLTQSPALSSRAPLPPTVQPPAEPPAGGSGGALGRVRAVVAGAVARLAGRDGDAEQGAAPQAAETPQERLIAAVRAGRRAAVVAVLPKLGPTERRACLPLLKEERRELRADWSRDGGRRSALLIAGAGCNTGAAAAAQWIAGSIRDGWSDSDAPALLAVLATREPEWQATVAQRLAARREAAWGWGEYPFVEHLLRLTDSPVPTDDAFVIRWVRQRAWQPGRQGRPAPWTPQLPGGRSLLDRLRADSYLPVLVPRLFEIPDIGIELDSAGRPGDAPYGWSGALALLAAEGVLDREQLIDSCLSRLLRGGRPADLRGFLGILAALDPTPEERAARAQTYVRLLPDAHSTVAGHAQQVLIELDDSGRLSAEQLAEASRAALFRSEKKLVRAQLSWLDQAARRDQDRAAVAVLAAADVFGHEDTAVQERALNLVARHLKRAGDGVLPELRAAAEALAPVHHTRAAELLGAAPAPADEPADLLPPAPEPQPLAAPLRTPAEVAEEVSAILAAEAGVADFERALDGLVRHAHQDRGALADALEPVLRDRQWLAWNQWDECTPRTIGYVADVVTGRTSAAEIRADRNSKESPLGGPYRTVFGRVLAARLLEAAWQVVTAPPPFLLATPTDSTGGLDPAELVRRLREYGRLGVTPGDHDLAQALLRVGRTAAPETVAAADALGTRAGQRLAAWLRAGGAADPAAVRLPPLAADPVDPADPAHSAGRSAKRLSAYEIEVRRLAARRVQLGLAETSTPVRLGAPFDALLAGVDPLGTERGGWGWSSAPAHWAAMLPHHRELVAARCQRRLAAVAVEDDRGIPGLLPLLAESGGPAGEQLHLGVAYGLGARHAEDRAAAVDALLVLAARGDLRSELLGGWLAELVRLGGVKPNRLAESVRDAARTGAYGTVWSVLAAALPGLLTGEPIRGTADLLAVAGDCVRRSGARGVVPEVSAAAARPGSGRLPKEARLLRDALGGH
ncbi:DUF6493 family protein [Streptomyces sp. NPDC092296]|uniref:DUF6493 family protein n=1 Tax=Streptomyces sp. NPDC092296 TaxID=3366012 RepID=UPI0037F99DD6